VEVVRDRFHLQNVLFVGARGMITQARIEQPRQLPGLGWITALRAPQIRALVEDYSIQPSLFDQSNLAEIASHPDYPGERLVVCRNPQLAEERARKRQALLDATESDLAQVKVAVDSGRLHDPARIGMRVGKVVGRHKVAKHFQLDIVEGKFSFSRKQESIASETALDGIYVIRTCVGAEVLTAAQTVATYKSLSNLERDFRTMKTVDVEIRPIRHHVADGVRAHAFLCMLAAHLVWYLRRDWAELTFRDQSPETHIDPVAKAQRSKAASTKAARRHQPDGAEVRPFQGLLDHLATLTRNTCQVPGTDLTIEKLSVPTPTQYRAFELLQIPIPLSFMSTRQVPT
jgi:transposase